VSVATWHELYNDAMAHHGGNPPEARDAVRASQL
jgi:hypothetical protein